MGSFSPRNPYWKITPVNYLVKNWKIKEIAVISSQNIGSSAVYGRANRQIVFWHPYVWVQVYVIAWGQNNSNPLC